MLLTFSFATLSMAKHSISKVSEELPKFIYYSRTQLLNAVAGF
jgi:hypothetical protein